MHSVTGERNKRGELRDVLSIPSPFSHLVFVLPFSSFSSFILPSFPLQFFLLPTFRLVVSILSFALIFSPFAVSLALSLGRLLCISLRLPFFSPLCFLPFASICHRILSTIYFVSLFFSALLLPLHCTFSFLSRRPCRLSLMPLISTHKCPDPVLVVACHPPLFSFPFSPLLSRAPFRVYFIFSCTPPPFPYLIFPPSLMLFIAYLVSSLVFRLSHPFTFCTFLPLSS